MLEDLPNEAEIARRQLLSCDVEALEPHFFRAELIPVFGNQILNDINPGVMLANFGDPSADEHVAATKVDNLTDAVASYEASNELDIGVSYRTTRS